ncbi:rhodanese-like domain-containing protein [Fictibacillus phosphorivorans]|uniref:rhodanese-like domain-containing protein n=1 Tax=Fictibacillus phosphorivorans TaxID=1221500 RepID=UPI0012D1D16B|nr:rhodanese-like domain-containing protein [Fictibacillus phosphorivorans]MQR93816.1 rhodanese-like domain-containing protein [Fictibacillus phosphorivorans]
MKTIEPKEVERLLESGNPLNIIDVRENDEVAQGIIPTATHIPLGEIHERTHELDLNKEYILVCRSGKRSEKACAILASNQFNVVNMSGGMLSWKGITTIK